MKVLVFDLDGTLYKLDRTKGYSTDEKIREYFLDYLKFDTTKALALFEDLRTNYTNRLPDFCKDNQLDMHNLVDFVCENETMEYVIELNNLSAILKKMPNKKYILTDNTLSQTIRTLNHLGVNRDWFVDIFHAESGGYIYKPHRFVYEEFFNKTGLNPEECVFFEDNYKNLVTAKQMGMTTVLVDNVQDKTDECDFYFDNLIEALEKLDFS